MSVNGGELPDFCNDPFIVKPKIQKAALIGGVLGFIFGFGVIFAWDDPNGSPVIFDCLEAPVKGLWWILKHLGIPSGTAGGIFIAFHFGWWAFLGAITFGTVAWSWLKRE
jgi:hypothetical protein